MYIKQEFNFDTFEFWGGAIERAEEIINLELEEEAENLIIEFAGRDGIIPTDGEINDFVWFEIEKFEYFKKL